MTGSLQAELADYLALRRSMGFKLRRAEKLLGQFVGYCEAIDAEAVTVEVALAWATLPAAASPSWVAHRLGVVRAFSRYLAVVDERNQVVPVGMVAHRPARATPFLYTEQQVQTAYGVGTLRARASGTPVITIMDLGGGWRPSDLKLAGQCFGYSPPRGDQMQGDGVPTAINNASDETSLDLQTAAAVAPKAQFRLVQTIPGGGGILDGFSRALSNTGGIPDVISLSYGGCALAENTAAPAFASAYATARPAPPAPRISTRLPRNATRFSSAPSTPT